MKKPHASDGEGQFSEGRTSKAIAAIATADSRRPQLAALQDSLEKNISILSSEISKGTAEYFSTKGKGQNFGNSPSSCEIHVSGEELSGWLFYATSAPVSGRISKSDGVKVSFRSSCISPASIETASSSNVSAFPVPISSPHLFTVELSPPYPVTGTLSKCITGYQLLKDLSRATADIWSSLPADFHAYWCASLADSLQKPLESLPSGARKKFLSEFEKALSSRKVIIETETDDGGKSVYFFELPSFSVAFRVEPDGRQMIISISGNESFLLWSKKRVYFKQG